MNIFAKSWLYIKNYFTESIYRKIFLFCTAIGAAVYLFSLAFPFEGSGVAACVFFTGAAFVTLVETMVIRNIFCEKINKMKVEHYKKIIDAGGSEMDALADPVFSPKEQYFIKRREKMYILVILGKVLIVILLFALIFGQVNIIM
jgi:hypothetical protein